MPNIELKYSEQAKKIIDQLKEFDQADFEEWFLNSPYVLVGDKYIQAYLLSRK